MSTTVATVDRDTIKNIVIEIMTELYQSQGSWGAAEEPPDDIVLDQVGLLGVSLFFSDVAAFVQHIDSELNELDYQISTANAYVLLSSAIQYAIDNGILEEKGWVDVADRFLTRAQDFDGVNDAIDITEVWGDLDKWCDILAYVMWSWKMSVAMYSQNEFTNDERVQLIRKILIGFRGKGWLDYSQPWAKRLIASLKEDWVYFGGGFGSNMGNGAPPYSVPDTIW